MKDCFPPVGQVFSWYNRTCQRRQISSFGNTPSIESLLRLSGTTVKVEPFGESAHVTVKLSPKLHKFTKKDGIRLFGFMQLRHGHNLLYM